VACDGQVLVSYDLLGMTADLRPKFVKRYDDGFARVVEAATAFRDEVRGREFPAPEHTFATRKRPVSVAG
jgi:3-methyl-2-oxobutanoate hydroxymethyltransferase